MSDESSVLVEYGALDVGYYHPNEALSYLYL